MSLLALVAASLVSPIPAPLDYGCVQSNGGTLACAASPERVAGGKGMVPARHARGVAAANTDGVCHSDPMKGRACRHHKLQAEIDRPAAVQMARDETR